MKKKKRLKKKSIIILFFAIMGLYFIIKIACLMLYQIRDEKFDELVENFKYSKTINIVKQKNDDVLNFNNLSIRNDFKDFTLLDDNDSYSNTYVLYGENNEVKSALILGIQETLTTKAKNYKYFYEDNEFAINSDIVQKYLDKNNIINDIQLIEFFDKINRKNKTNIFTSISEIRNRFYLNYMLYVLVPEINTLYQIDGDYKGYAYVKDNLIQANVLSDDRAYIYSFLDRNLFTDEYTSELLNTIKIN